MKRAFLLYEMDYKTWNSNFRDELTKGDREYKKWFFSHASKLTLSDSLYREIFIENPIFSTGFFHAALNPEQSLFRDDADSEKIFFALYPGSFLLNIAQPINKKFVNDRVKEFCQILDSVDNKQKYIIVEFNKSYSPFDYEKTFKTKEKLRKEHELEMKELKKKLGNTD